MAQQITKQTLIGEMLQMDMGIAAILMAAGMHCVGCPSSAMESLEEACMVHGMDADQVKSSAGRSRIGKHKEPLYG